MKGSQCIVAQSASSIPVDQQLSCGPIVQPTLLCTSTNVTVQQVQTAAVLALGAPPNAWSQPQEWVVLMQLAAGVLGCQVSGSAQQTTSSGAQNSSTPLASFLTQSASSSCLTPGVNYCGPGNSLDNSVAAGLLPTVAPCLNAGCFAHDNCYAAHCITASCYWTAETSSCDVGLLSICSTTCALSDPGRPRL